MNKKRFEAEHNHARNHHHEHGRGHHHHSHAHHHNAGGNIKTAFFLNLFFVFIELAGGFLTNSFAIISDAIHDLGDCAAIGCAWGLEKFSEKEPDESYTYGYRRYSLVSALITSVILVAGSVGVVVGAVKRFSEPEEINGTGMLIIAVFGVIINGAAAFKTSEGKGASEKAINLHLLEDVFGWLAVLAGSIFIYAFDWYFVDALLSVIISVFLLINAIKGIYEVLSVLLEKKPAGFDIEAYKEKLMSIKGVIGAHHIHIWSMDGENILATVHLEVSGKAESGELSRIKHSALEISEEAGIDHFTVQIDDEGDCKEENCGLR